MADTPRRLRLLKAITAAIEFVQIANDFKVDIGEGHVFRGRAFFGENDPVPMVSILEAPLPPDQLEATYDGDANGGKLELIVQGFTLDDAANPTDPAHILMADVKQALALEKQKLRDFNAFGFNWVMGVSIGLGVVRPPDEISSRAYFWMPVTVDFVDDLLNPYDD